MAATSVAQRRLFAVAEHDPSALSPKNKGLADLSHKTLHDFAATPEKGLPEHKADGGWMERARKLADGKVPEHWMGKAFDSNKGGLHRATHTPAGETIPKYRVKKLSSSGSAHEKHMAQAAINANPRYYN